MRGGVRVLVCAEACAGVLRRVLVCGSLEVAWSQGGTGVAHRRRRA